MDKTSLGDGPTGGFRQRLFELRQRKGWSQSELARHVWGTVEDSRGYTVAKNRDRISAYESGKAVPERSNLTAIADALGVTVEELAPDLVMENPNVLSGGAASFRMSMLPGTDRAHIKVDAVVPLAIAVQIATLLKGASERLGGAGF